MAGIFFFFFRFDSFDLSADLLVLEEYKSGLTIQTLNKLADAAMFPLKRRNLPPLLLEKRIPMLMLTNYEWQDCYPNVACLNPGVMATLDRRWLEVVVEEGSNLYSLIDWLSDAVALTQIVDLSQDE